MASVNVIAFENGVGNSRDLTLMTRALEELGCGVAVTRVSPQARRWRRSTITRTIVAAGRRLLRRRLGVPARFDVNVMLEHIWPHELQSARRNIVVPNPEWFDKADQRLLAEVDCAWTKTAHSLEAFAKLGCVTHDIGFDSEDRYDPAVPRQAGFFHLAGKSRMKGSARLLQLWSRHPEWPELNVVHSRKAAFKIVTAANIRYETRYLTDAGLREMQNRYQFHLCMSETEGWGHYIPEALSVGAVVIATDAPPMNELVTSDHGLLVSSEPVGRQHLATTYAFHEQSLERIVGVSVGMTASESARRGGRAREWFTQNKLGFAARVGRALNQLENA